MARVPKNNLNTEIENVLDNKKLKCFVKWYCNGAIKKDYDIEVKPTMGTEYDYGISNYLERIDVQEAIALVAKSNKDFNLCKIYNTMVSKALQGDVNSANWVVKFSDSAYFKSNKTEIDNILEGLNLNADD